MKFTIVQAVIPDYRIGLFQELIKKNEVKLICGDEYFTPTVKTSNAVESLLCIIKSNNYYFFSRKCLMQIWPGFIKTLFSSETVVFELNPRALTTWLFLIVSKLNKNSKIILWGHLKNRNGHIKKKSARSFMMNLADGFIFYTKSQLEEFNDLDFKKNTHAGFAPNSVLFSNQVIACSSIGKDFLYVGRLVAEKKPIVLLNAFIKSCENGLNEACLHLVGDGDQRKIIDKIAKDSKYRDRIYIHGHNNDYGFLKTLYSQSVCTVSPGYVGLSITQSFSFGRPMIISQYEPHAPEIEAFIPDINGEYFETDDINVLSEKLVSFYSNRELWSKKSDVITEVVRSCYTYEAMAKGFSDLIERVNCEKK
jgi:glycosyltransferase involved in cell wall biosynthesis